MTTFEKRLDGLFEHAEEAGFINDKEG